MLKILAKLAKVLNLINFFRYIFAFFFCTFLYEIFMYNNNFLVIASFVTISYCIVIKLFFNNIWFVVFFQSKFYTYVKLYIFIKYRKNE